MPSATYWRPRLASLSRGGDAPVVVRVNRIPYAKFTCSTSLEQATTMTKRRERGHETFHQAYAVYEVSALLKDLADGAVPIFLETTVNRHEIELYRAFLEGIPHPEVPAGMT